jgi:hypothetical protein
LSKLKHLPFHPFLFSAYPILALFAINIDQIRSNEVVGSLLFTLAASVVIWFLLNLVIKDWLRSAILVSLYFTLFFTYGHVYHYLEMHHIFGISLGRHRLLIVIWFLIASAGTWLIIRKTKDTQKPTEALNIIGMVLIAMPMISMLIYTIRLNISEIKQTRIVARDGQISLQNRPEMPDIYYIVLDAYTRGDVLKEKFNLDNSAFIEELEKLGFYVADCSQSNYAQTELSIASTLQMDYMEKISERYLGGSNIDMNWMPELIRNNEVRRNLKQLGYTDVIFENGFYWLLWNDADVIYSQSRSGLSRAQSFLDINGFDVMLLQESAALMLSDSFSIFADRFKLIQYYPNNVQRDRILNMFDKFKTLPTSVKSPKFVYAHFIAPHSPIVFGPDGEPVNPIDDANPESFITGYRGEVLYLNKRILEIVRKIIEVSDTPPIIIIQGDHGDDRAWGEDRMKILNAYYLPGVDKSKFYSTISPVNSFRLVFNEFFDGNYDILPDKSYLSSYQDPFNYQEISNLCTNGD